MTARAPPATTRLRLQVVDVLLPDAGRLDARLGEDVARVAQALAERGIA